jgi:hypothetical protein
MVAVKNILIIVNDGAANAFKFHKILRRYGISWRWHGKIVAQ